MYLFCFSASDCIEENGAHCEEVEEVGEVGGDSSSVQVGFGKITGFIVESRSECRVKRFRTNGIRYVIRAEPIPQDENPINWIERLMRNLHRHLVAQSTSEENFLGVSVNSNHFDKGIAGLSLRPIRDFSVDNLVHLVSGITQSNESFKLDESFIVEATYVEVPTGKGRRKKQTIDTVKQRSFVSIANDDNLCLPRALVVGELLIKYSDNRSPEIKKLWSDIRDGRRPFQKHCADRLFEVCKVRITDRGCGYIELEQFQRYFWTVNIAIIVFDSETFGEGEAPWFDGRRSFEEKCIFLMYNSRARHFDVIVNLSGIVQPNYFCVFCNTKYKTLNSHKCEKKCPQCYTAPSCDTTQASIKCTECHREFYGDCCFSNHKKIGGYKPKSIKTICDVVQYCPKCFKVINTTQEEHECGIYYCRQCSSKHDPNELCYIRLIKERKPRKDAPPNKYLYIFYDFETRQDTSFKNHSSMTEHSPVLCVVQQTCTDCLEVDDLAVLCPTCGVREMIFDRDPVNQLIDFCIRSKTSFTRIIVLAHKSGGFDCQFILKALAEERDDCYPSVILNGRNIVSLTVGKTKFIDSLNYMHMKLSALPAAFGLPESAKKGYFPHLFTSLENNNYVGAYPEPRYYGADTMSTKDRTKFFEWYETTKGLVFDMKKEMLDYCRMDVEILRRACLAFRKIMVEVGRTDPFVDATTIASACSHLYRKNFLKPKSIGLVPPGGYYRSDKYSQKSIEWLLLCERECGREIIHSGRAREFRLPEGFKVDGYLPSDINTVGSKPIIYEFQGCFFHACPTCFATQRDKPSVFGRTPFEVYENTQRKNSRMRDSGYEVREMWECEFDRLKSTDPEIKEFLNKHPVLTKITLDPREAFFGGRTENTVTLYDVKAGEKIQYTDICSLYPFVCKRGRFPVGHPRIYLGEECNELTGGNNNDLTRVEGLVKCKILPPRNGVYLPVLPVKMNGRLMFALCRSCCGESKLVDCDHEQADERAFTGVWVVDELRKAVELGYAILEIYVIWHYDHATQYDQTTGRGGLFAQYVNTFLKIKTQASGWPAGCSSEEAKMRYLRDYKDKEGITLDSDKIEKNGGLRSVAKLSRRTVTTSFVTR